MLPKKNRLTTEEFKDVFKKGKRYSTTSLLCVYMNEEKKNAKKTGISVSVTKKHYPRAVDRNRLRRLIYNCIPPIQIQKKVIILLRNKVLPKEEDILCKEVSSFIRSL